VVRLDREKKRVARQYRWGLGNKIANAPRIAPQRPAFAMLPPLALPGPGERLL